MENFSKSEDWLAVLEWGLQLIGNPSPARVLEGFESWNYRNRLRPQLRQLERARLLERKGAENNQTLQLTPQGHLKALGGVDPRTRWERPWDGKWRLLLFDLPLRSHAPRIRLWRWLRAQRFGLLQRSVWVSPDKIPQASLPLQHLKITPEGLSIIEGGPTLPGSDLDFVKSAWDFSAINRRYQVVLDFAAQGVALATAQGTDSLKLRQWLASERSAWLAALEIDPMLPEVLLPSDYLGLEAFKQRRAAYSTLSTGTTRIESHSIQK
jgi:phenylacetic acid degradation operon negative regulatory protein